jgi:hypothetical protein
VRIQHRRGIAAAAAAVVASLAGANVFTPEPAANPGIRPRQAEVAPGLKSQSQRLADAFQAATGHRTGFIREEKRQSVTTKPLQIVQLPFGPALLTSRKINEGCHACTGSIGVYYVKEVAGKTLVTGRWPEAVKGWGWGAPPPQWHLTTRFTSNPAIFASGGYMGQGIVMKGATLTELGPTGPATSDMIGTGYTDEAATADGERPACRVKGKIANIRKDHSFDVVVSGSISAVDRYAKRNGRFVATSKIDWEMPCELGRRPAP